LGRYLVTTGDEQTWPVNQPILFLGTWCKRLNRQHLWSKFDSETAKPYLDKEAERKISVLFDQLLLELTKALNQFHQVSHSERYWNIILGPWLRQYLKIIINRYESLNIALSQYDISDILTYRLIDHSLVTRDIAEFNSMINNDTWNSLLYSELLLEFNQSNLDFHNLDANYELRHHSQRYKTPLNRKFLFFLAKLASKFHRESDAFIVNSYLPKINEIKLQIGLRQIPQLWQTPDLNYENVNGEDRIRFGLDYEKYSGLDRVARKFIAKLLPNCYLESYKSVCRQVEAFSWPSRPKFIFTSNSFAYDEGFKFWTAKKVESGVPYYVGQHGANYGTLKYSDNWTEMTTCDKFISWGWDSAYKNVNAIPAFNFKIMGVKNFCHDKTGSLLLIERGPGLHDGPEDRQFMHSVYQQDMLDFFDCLPGFIQKDFVARLHHGSNDLGSSDKELWEAHSGHVKIDIGATPMNKLLSKSRFVVITYDSSAILEILKFDIPIICFWRGGFNHLLPDAIPYYELLSAVGIIHDNFESAAKHIVTYWGDPDLWWQSKEVQIAKQKFCNKYSRSIDKPILNLIRILNDN